ncbi:MFS transporter [Streptomyces sp. HSW2009]|uniref:MFS transporter n=1 Tax=Streptomyces sp. HSW2009 TaxID=3142890 RepID=UPI0032EAAA0A
MLTIGIVLLIQHTTGSYGIAGAVSATAGVSMAVFAPQSGKLADRFGQAAVLVPGVLTHTASISLLIALALTGAPLWTLFVAAVPAGASVPQVGPMVRARWAALLGDGPPHDETPDAIGTAAGTEAARRAEGADDAEATGGARAAGSTGAANGAETPSGTRPPAAVGPPNGAGGTAGTPAPAGDSGSPSSAHAVGATGAAHRAAAPATTSGPAPVGAPGGDGTPAGAATPGTPEAAAGRGRSPLLTTAAAFESVTDEFTFVIGPVLATALCTGLHPAAGLSAEAVLTLVGGLLFAAQRRTQPVPSHPRTAAVSGATALAGAAPADSRRTGGRRPGRWPTRSRTNPARTRARPAPAGTRPAAPVRATSALGVPGVRVLAVVFLGIGTVFGGLQVSLTAFTEEIGQPGINGVLYGIFAAGNMVAGIVCGALTWRRSPQQRLLVAYPLLTLATSMLWAVHAVPLLGALGLLVGLCIAPALITGYTLVETLVPAHARTEAFTWLTGAVALGQAGAATAAGQLADGFGPSAGFAVPLAGTGLALATLLLLRGHLATASDSRLAGGSARVVGHREAVAVD